MSVDDSNFFQPLKEKISYNIKFYQKYKLDDIIYTILLKGDDTQGKFSLIEMNFPLEKEKTISMHRHTREDIILYVIEGSFSINYGNGNIKGVPGMAIKLEKNIKHSYKKIGNGQGRLLMLFFPAGFEKYFGDLESSSLSSLNNESIQDLNGYDERVRLHLLEKNYGWIFSM